MGFGGLHLERQVVEVSKLSICIRGVLFLYGVSDFVVTARATIHAHSMFDVFLAVFVACFQTAFAHQPATVALSHIVELDGTDDHVLVQEVARLRSMQLLGDGMPGLLVDVLLDG